MLRRPSGCRPPRWPVAPDSFARLARRAWLRLLIMAGLLAPLPLVGSGCATIGRDFPSERVHEIQIGQTKKSDLLGRFGRPYRRGIEDGDSTWTYLNAKISLLGGQSRTRDLYIRFEGETVRSFTYNADVP